MNARPSLSWLALLVALALAVDSARSEDPPSAADMQALWAKYATPGERHKELGRLVGTWDVELRMGPAATPMKGTAETTWWLAGRFITTRTKIPGAFMGQDLEHVDVLGWDNFKHKWVGFGAGSLGTALMPAEGVVVDPTNKVRVMYGPLDEYLSGEHDKQVKYTTRLLSDDKYVLEVRDLAIGENGQVVFEFTYTRRKE